MARASCPPIIRRIHPMNDQHLPLHPHGGPVSKPFTPLASYLFVNTGWEGRGRMTKGTDGFICLSHSEWPSSPLGMCLAIPSNVGGHPLGFLVSFKYLAVSIFYSVSYPLWSFDYHLRETPHHRAS